MMKALVNARRDVTADALQALLVLHDESFGQCKDLRRLEGIARSELVLHDESFGQCKTLMWAQPTSPQIHSYSMMKALVNASPGELPASMGRPTRTP